MSVVQKIQRLTRKNSVNPRKLFNRKQRATELKDVIANRNTHATKSGRSAVKHALRTNSKKLLTRQ